MCLTNPTINNEYIGAMCHEFRKYILKQSQSSLAKEFGLARETISRFESGNAVTVRIFIGYVKKGLFDWVSPEKWNGWEMTQSGKL